MCPFLRIMNQYWKARQRKDFRDKIRVGALHSPIKPLNTPTLIHSLASEIFWCSSKLICAQRFFVAGIGFPPLHDCEASIAGKHRESYSPLPTMIERQSKHNHQSEQIRGTKKAVHWSALKLTGCGQPFRCFECWRVRVMRIPKNSQIRWICISGSLFLFYASLFCKWHHIVLNFRRFLSLVAKIPHRSAGFLPASFLSMQVGPSGETWIFSSRLSIHAGFCRKRPDYNGLSRITFTKPYHPV